MNWKESYGFSVEFEDSKTKILRNTKLTQVWAQPATEASLWDSGGTVLVINSNQQQRASCSHASTAGVVTGPALLFPHSRTLTTPENDFWLRETPFTALTWSFSFKSSVDYLCCRTGLRGWTLRQISSTVCGRWPGPHQIWAQSVVSCTRLDLQFEI